MKKRHLLISMLLMLMMVLFVIPAAQAAPDCLAAPGPGVDWSYCDKTNIDFSGQDLSDMTLVGTDFTGSNIDSALFVGSNLTNAVMQSMSAGAGVLIVPEFSGAVVKNLDFSNNPQLFATFVLATGEPIFPTDAETIVLIQCPDESFDNDVPIVCPWVPTAVSLTDISAAAVVTQLPFYTAGLLGMFTVLLMVGLRQRKAQKAVV